MKITHIALLWLTPLSLFAQSPTEKYLNNQTPTYTEIISFYKQLDTKYNEARLFEAGTTDGGKPLHLFVISKDGVFEPKSIRTKNKRIILINNGIHPGEPDGIDASMKWSEELLQNITTNKELDRVVLCIIPVYNVDGCLNRGKNFRVNQNGPEEGGFRGNARNLDLNRDFIKMDSENARSFAKIFQSWQPEFFVDNHVSDGADYQYTMTLIATQHNKLHPVLANYMQHGMIEALYQDMAKRGYEMCPYVESHGRTPDTGLEGFLETPRYSTGYSTLFNCIGFVTETHMWKPYKERVLATYEFMRSLLSYTASHHQEISTLKEQVDEATQQQQIYALDWVLDTTKYTLHNFKGYEAKYKKSNISGLDRLYYDRNAPYNKPIRYYNECKATINIDKPNYYVLPQAWKEVIERLKLNNTQMQRLSRDTTMEVEVYYITDYKTSPKPYEGHYLHYNVKTRKALQTIQYYAGDYLIPVNQSSNRFIVETLEPQAVDSYFAWNFFDAILQQKEWFSDYVFEEKAEELLKNDPVLQADLKGLQQKDTSFAKNHDAQLAYIFKHSPYYEKTHLRYPVARIVTK